ncbi:MAG: type IV pilus modification PilV family protein [Actinomycetes bacterium]
MSRLRSRQDEGFTLVEIIVAISLLAIAAVGVLPLILGSIRAGYSAKLQTQSKNLVQERIDKMRNLPFHVDASNGPYLDLLDTYFPNLVAAGAPVGVASIRTVNSGFVDSAGTRVSGEPNGSFYRYVVPTDPSFPLFRTVVDTQLLDKDLTVLTAPPAYNAATPGLDAPPARLLGVTVISSWPYGTAIKTFRTYTQIADAKPAAPVISGSARASALTLVGSGTDGVKTSVTAGYIDESGSVSTGSVGSAKSLGAFIDRFPGTRVTGASQLADAPPDVTTPLSANDAGQDVSSGCAIACFGSNYVSGVYAQVAGGLPVLGTSASPLVSGLMSTGTNAGLSLATGVESSLATNLMLAAGPSALVRNLGGSGDLVRGTGYLTTTAGSGHAVNTHVTTSGVLDVLPTTFTPANRGVVEVVLSSASLDCRATGVAGGATASATYTATVYYWSAATNGYVALGTVQNGNTSDPLPDPSTLTVYSSGGTVLHLSDYISQWSSALNGIYNQDSNGRYAQGAVDGIVSVTTVDLRPGDTTSGLQAKLGAMSCSAEDNR